MAVQFAIDHLARPPRGTHALPPLVDAALVAHGAKARPGALAYATAVHRLAVLSKWHRLHGWPVPATPPVCERR